MLTRLSPEAVARPESVVELNTRVEERIRREELANDLEHRA